MTLEKDIADIKERNTRVEANKAWETSHTRIVCILVLTYILVYILMVLTDTPKPHLSALVPTLGFYLSTLTVGVVKSFWVRKFYKR